MKYKMHCIHQHPAQKLFLKITDTMLAIRLFSVARPARQARETASSAGCAPLRALASGFGMVLRSAQCRWRDRIPLPYGDNLHLIIKSLIKLNVASTI